MKQTQVFGGKNVDTAVKNACSALNFSENELEYDVISSGTSGIFGIVGRKDAKIRVILPDSYKQESSYREKEGIQSIVDEAFGAEATEEKFNDSSVEISEELISLGKEILQKMVDLVTEDVKISAELINGRLFFNIKGGNTGVLIGKKGQTLDAMQLLIDKIINRKNHSRIIVEIDIEGYVESRENSLKSLAYRMADKVKKTGRPATINQMSAQGRRIIHLALKNDTGIRTQSMGEGYYRKVVIFPKKNRFGKKAYLRK